MTAPISAHVGETFPTMRYPVVDFCLVRIRFSIGLSDTLSNNLGIAFLVTGELAIGALHTCCVLEEISAKGTTHNVIKLLLHKLVAILLMNFFFLLADSTFSAETNVVLLFLICLFN
jgi:hypothetical protein